MGERTYCKSGGWQAFGVVTLKPSHEGQGRGQDVWRGGRASQAEEPEQTSALGCGHHGQHGAREENDMESVCQGTVSKESTPSGLQQHTFIRLSSVKTLLTQVSLG